MKIGSPADKPALTPATTRTASGDTAKTPATTQASTQVELSSTASTLMSGTDAANPEFDADKVAKIAQAIADGKFTVDHAAIADKLIANAKELLGKTSH